MQHDEKAIYEKTIARLHRAGCRSTEQQIIYLAEEIERYRAKIEYLQTARPVERSGQALCFVATTYTSPFSDLPEEWNTLRAQDDIALILAKQLQAAGAIRCESQYENSYLRCTKHTGTVCVVMPKREE